MSRPPSITDDEILAAARAIFLDKGITATVEDVAARCGVGEATVFRRFRTKQVLFSAAMDTANEPRWLHAIGERARAADLRLALTELAHDVLVFGRRLIPVTFLKMSNPAWRERELPSPPWLRLTQGLTEFFEIEMAAGRVDARDARVAARIFIGALQHFVTFELLTKSTDALSTDIFVEGVVDMFVTPRARKRKG